MPALKGRRIINSKIILKNTVSLRSTEGAQNLVSKKKKRKNKKEKKSTF